ncbi:hypothetical protein BGZ98_005396 [Dissophora globulifera]|nr:hypothetical protein BGZ98_005396 [Dissophora globulifera]
MRARSGRDRDRESWSDSNWRSIFDAALVKAQQAVQLDELQETALAANLYAQAANDLARVIPLCGSERKQQSMLAIQAIYLDRVTQLREAAQSKGPAIPAAHSSSNSAASSEGNDGGYNRRQSVPVYADEMQQYSPHQYQPQPFRSPMLQPRQQLSRVPQQQQYQHQQLRQFQPSPRQMQPMQQQLQFQPSPQQTHQTQHLEQQYRFQQQQAQRQQDQQLETQRQQFGTQRQQEQHFEAQWQQDQQLEDEQQQHDQQDKGFRLFGKKRSKTQPSAPQPPEFVQASHFNGAGPDRLGSYSGYNNAGHNAYPTPSTPSPIPPSPPPVVVSPIFMTHPPAQSSHRQQQQEQPTKSSSSKWRPFGKKKSKSLSTKVEAPGVYDPQRDNAQVVPKLPAFSSNADSRSHQHLVDPSDRADVYAGHARTDWYAEPTMPQKEDEDELYQDEYRGEEVREDVYYDDHDEDIDPYYNADINGRAKAFEGQDLGTLEKKPVVLNEEPEPAIRRPLNQSASSYSEKQSFTPMFDYPQTDSDAPQEPLAVLELQSVPVADQQVYTSNYTDGVEDYSEYQALADSFFLQEDQRHPPLSFMEGEDPFVEDHVEESPIIKNTAPAVDMDSEAPMSAFKETNEDIEFEPRAGSELKKSKSRRTWYGKIKKEKEPDKLDKVAKLMDEAMFGGGKPSHKASKSKLSEVPSVPSLSKRDSITKAGSIATMDSFGKTDSLTKTHSISKTDSYISEQRQDIAPTVPEAQPAPEIQSKPEVDLVFPAQLRTRDDHDGEDNLVESKSIEQHDEATHQTVLGTDDAVPEFADRSKEDVESPVMGQDAKPTTSEIKRAKSRHLGIFKSKKSKESGKDFAIGIDTTAEAPKQQASSQERPAEESMPPTPLVMSNGDKSTQSQHIGKSTQNNSRKSVEMAAALAVRPKDKKQNSNGYVPYEYQEDVEGPLMERVEVRENRDIIGFVLPVEEVIDYTAEGNEEAALENWDSWVSQLESFERVLSDKGMKKDKAKKAKKEKAKSNRSSLIATARPDTMVMDHAPIAGRPSFQSSRSGESEAPSQLTPTSSTKKHWWSTKRRETISSMYHVPNSFSTADLEQSRHLSTLLLSQDQVRSSDRLTLNTQLVSMPISLTEPPTPAPELVSKEAPAVMETVHEDKKDEKTPDVQKVEEQQQQQQEQKQQQEQQEQEQRQQQQQEQEQQQHEEVEEVEETPIAPKSKTESGKSKLLPISTPLLELLKLDDAEELWQYVYQAKKYAASRMSKGDKRSAAIALKRAQTLEARWQEVLLEMNSANEDTDDQLEEDDEEEEESEEEVIVPVKNDKNKKVVSTNITVAGSSDPTPRAAAPTPTTAPATPKPITITTNTPPNTHNDIDEEDEEEEESYAAQRRKSAARSRSNTTLDKYSKYKVNKATSPNVSKSLAIVAEEETSEQGEQSAKAYAASDAGATGDDDGRLGPDATLEQMLESTSVVHLKFYIQRMKTDTVAKARNGSKFAALEGMKNVKILQQRLEELQSTKEDSKEDSKEDEAEEKHEQKAMAKDLDPHTSAGSSKDVVSEVSAEKEPEQEAEVEKEE